MSDGTLLMKRVIIEFDGGIIVDATSKRVVVSRIDGSCVYTINQFITLLEYVKEKKVADEL